MKALTKSLLILIVSFSINSCNKRPADSSVVRSGKYKKTMIEAYQKMGLFCASNMVPGLTVAVSIDNKIVWADGIGHSNKELNVKASPSHKFRIGQLTETITALTALKLAEEGKLSLEKPVYEYLPDSVKGNSGYSIFQLGTHTSGLRAEENMAGQGNNYTIEEQVKSFISKELVYQPGTYFLHSEYGYDLLGHIIEKTTNEKFVKVVKETLTDTLNLDNTIPDIFFRITENRSSTYDYDIIAQPVIASQVDLRGKEASAGYLSSVTDLVKMGNLLLYPGFLKQESIDLMTKAAKINSEVESRFSFGMIVAKDNRDRLFYGQRGSVTGGCATLLIYPEDKLVIAMAGNVRNNSWELPIFDVAELFLNQLNPELAKEQVQEKE